MRKLFGLLGVIAVFMWMELMLDCRTAIAAERVALIIGNSKYDHTNVLANPTADARKMAMALRKVGFGKVDLKLDLKYSDMRSELRAFNSRATGAEMALVFFAGHGMEFGGKTFLIPTDARLALDQDIEYEVVPLDLVLTAAEPSQLQLVILDACRDNPLATKMVIGRSAARSVAAGASPNTPQLSVGRGLAVVQSTGNNTLIAYAAKHGSFALDGDGDNSPYTSALLDHIEEPGVEIRILFGMVRDSVMQRTSGRQEPFVYGSMGGRQLYLVPPRAQAASQPVDAAERQMWATIQGKNSREMFELYLQLYPHGRHTPEARQRIAALTTSQSSSPAPGSRPAPLAGDIVIATAGPMSGPNAAFGLQMRLGAERAVADINSAGGVLGRRLRLVVADDKSDPREGVAVANSLAGQRVAFVAGHFNSGISIPASDVYEREGIIMITPSATNPRLTQRNLRYAFRMAGRDDRQGIYAGQYLVRNLGGKRIAIVHDGTVYGKGLADELKSTMNRLGKKEVSYESVAAGEKDFRALVARLKQNGAEIVYWGGLHAQAGLILRRLREAGMSTQLVAGDGLATSEFWQVAGPAAEGTLMTFFPDPRKALEASAVVKRFRESKNEPEGYVIPTYAVVQAWVEAAKKAGTINAADIARTLVASRFTTALGTVGFDPQGDFTLPGYAMYRWSQGNFAELR